MHFRFRLRAVDDIPPWSVDTGRPYLSWFALTEGWFWIEAGGDELFRYTSEVLVHLRSQYPDARPTPLPYEDYYVVRYWEDLLEMLPAVLDPVPDDLAARVGDADGWRAWQDAARRWHEAQEEDAAWDTYYAALGWWDERTWDAGHLTHPPRLWLWRVADTVHVRWDNRGVAVDGIPVWEARQGEITLPVTEFLSAVESFHVGLLAEMGRRIDAARASWSRPDIAIDLDQIESEQHDRAGWLAPAVDPRAAETRRAVPWDEVRAAIETVTSVTGR